MGKRPSKPAVESAAVKLRAIALSSGPGALLGSEEALLERVGCSRATMRQVARLLEREGFLRVRRGIKGGYFADRPSEQTIENTVSSYLEMLDIETQDVTAVASALWIEVVRKAAATHVPGAREMAEKFKKRVAAIKANAAFTDIRILELESRKAIFQLADCRYIELIFNINTNFASRRFTHRPDIDGTARHLDFVRAWRDAKIMELTAIAEGDVELSTMAARHIRSIWHRRVWDPEMLKG